MRALVMHRRARKRPATSDVVLLDADTPAAAAARRLQLSGVSGAPVLDRGRVVGVITLTDLLASPIVTLTLRPSGPFPPQGHPFANLRVWHLMTVGPIVVAADQPLVEAVLPMDRHRVNRLPVVDRHGRSVGIIARSDVIHALARRARGGRAARHGRPRRRPVAPG